MGLALAPGCGKRGGGRGSRVLGVFTSCWVNDKFNSGAPDRQGERQSASCGWLWLVLADPETTVLGRSTGECRVPLDSSKLQQGRAGSMWAPMAGSQVE